MSKSNGGIVIDRSRLSFADSVRAARLHVALQKAQQELDLELLDAVFKEQEALVEKIVVSVPKDFFVADAPDEAFRYEPGWIGYLQHDKYQELMDYAREVSEAGKKDR